MKTLSNSFRFEMNPWASGAVRSGGWPRFQFCCFSLCGLNLKTLGKKHLRAGWVPLLASSGRVSHPTACDGCRSQGLKSLPATWTSVVQSWGRILNFGGELWAVGCGHQHLGSGSGCDAPRLGICWDNLPHWKCWRAGA